MRNWIVTVRWSEHGHDDQTYGPYSRTAARAVAERVNRDVAAAGADYPIAGWQELGLLSMDTVREFVAKAATRGP
jgi:hypothetical protein